MNEYARGVPDSPAQWGMLATILAVFGTAFLIRALWRKAKGRPVSTRRGEDTHGPTVGASKSAWKWWIGTGVAAYVVTVIIRIAMGKSGTDVWLSPALVFPLCGVLLPARVGVLAWSARKGNEFRERRHPGKGKDKSPAPAEH